MPTFGEMIMEGVRQHGLTADEAAEVAGVSPNTFYRHRTGKAKKAITAEDSLCKLVEQVIVDPMAVPTYCQERCQIGKLRDRLKLKTEKPRPASRGPRKRFTVSLYLKTR